MSKGDGPDPSAQDCSDYEETTPMMLLSRGRCGLAWTFAVAAASFVIAFPNAARADEGSPQSTATPAPTFQRVLHRITVSVTPSYDIFTTSDKAENSPSNTTRLGWNIGYDLSPNVQVYWNRGNLDDQSGRTMDGKKISYAPVLEDIINAFGVNVKITPDWTMGTGLFRRWRECCPAAGDASNNDPAVEQSAFLDTSLNIGPNTVIGRPFNVFADAGIFAHHLNASQDDTVPSGALVPPSDLPVLQMLAFTYSIPVFHQKRFIPYISAQEWGTYFDNAYLPVYTDLVQTGVNIAGSRYVSYTINVRNFHGHDLGASTSHYTWIYAAMTFHSRL